MAAEFLKYVKKGLVYHDVWLFLPQCRYHFFYHRQNNVSVNVPFCVPSVAEVEKSHLVLAASGI